MCSLSIVVVNWNTSAILRKCLSALQAAELPAPAEIIVVDNASTDDSVAMLRSEFPEVCRIENAANVGFARANNQGLAMAQGRYTLLLNSDTVVPPGALAELVEFMEQHPEAGACGPRLLRPDGTVQPFAFGDDPTPRYLLQRAFNRFWRRQAMHNWNTLQIRSVDWVAGTCLLARRAAVEQVGPLDENFFMYFEDNDWCLRMRQRGWKISYNPHVAITHLGGASLSQNPRARQAYYASLEYFYRKHYGAVAGLWLRLALPFYRFAVRY